jgi:predicted DNA-binding protein with PD1-like motif
LAGSSFKAIGALSYAKLGRLNWETKQYDPACVLSEQLELLSLIGDIALKAHWRHRPQGWGAAGARARRSGTLRRDCP